MEERAKNVLEMFKAKKGDTDPLMRCSSELAKQRGGSCLVNSLGGKGEKEKETESTARWNERESCS